MKDFNRIPPSYSFLSSKDMMQLSLTEWVSDWKIKFVCKDSWAPIPIPCSGVTLAETFRRDHCFWVSALPRSKHQHIPASQGSCSPVISADICGAWGSLAPQIPVWWRVSLWIPALTYARELPVPLWETVGNLGVGRECQACAIHYH